MSEIKTAEVEALLTEMVKANLEGSKQFSSSTHHTLEIDKKIKNTKVRIAKPVLKKVRKGTQKGK